MHVRARGFTLVELILALVVGSAAVSLMVGTLARQQKFFGAASEILDARAQLRDAADILTSDLRGAAVSLLGLPVMTDSAVEMYASVASSVACAVQSPTVLALPPMSLSSATTFTSMVAMPDTGDLALVFVHPVARPDSGKWEALRVAAFAARSLASSCPASTGFTLPADAGATGYAVTLASAPSVPVRPGTPVHFVRRGRYSLYKSSDAKWYLGYRRCAASAAPGCATIQPVSGPYDAWSQSKAGVAFRYFDADGAALAPSSSMSVARIDIVVRGKSASSARLPGDTRAAYADSVIVSVSPRNRLR
jgi:prepilin-type N-terminal cleavage/methylation domain-containing protein